MQLADLFITLLRTLEQNPKDAQAVAERHEAAPERVERHARALMALLDTDTPATSLADWVLSCGDLPPIERSLLAAQAIDVWYEPLAAHHHPQGTTSGSHVAARRRYNRYGRFNTDAADGQVILRAGLLGRAMNIRETTPPAPFDIADLFQTLLLVPPSLPVGPRHDEKSDRRVAIAYRRVAEITDHNPIDPGWTPVLGVVPLAVAEEDIAIRHFPRDGEDWYDPIPRDLGRAAAEAIDALAERGANIVLFPEMSVHPDTLEAIKAAVRRHAVDGPIRYVLAGLKEDVGKARGAGSEPFNRVVVLDRTGAEIGAQTKLHCWDLDAEQCRSYDLRRQDGRPLDGAKEFIAPGDRFTILELPGMGRLAVAICEDLGRSQPSAWIGHGMMVDWLVSPVMDGGLTTERWQAREGAASSRAGYCRVVVANSMALSHRFNRVCRAKGENDTIIRDCGVALLFQPRASQDSAPHVRLLTLDLDRPAPGYVCARWEPDRWPQLTETASPKGDA